MKVYFYSKIDAFLKVNGQYYGKINKTPSLANIDEGSLLEFLPVSQEYYPCTILGFSSKQANVFKLKNSLLIYPNFSKKRNAPYKIITQTYVDLFNGKYLFTILADGSYKFHLNGDFFITGEIPFLPNDFKIEQNGDLVFISFVSKKKCLFVYQLQNNNLNLAYEDLIDDYSYSLNELKVFKNYAYPLDVQITETWAKNKTFKLTSVHGEYDKNLLIANEKIKGFIFINLLILNVDVSCFLSSNLIEKASSIKEFLDYPYLCFENFESGNDNEYLILTKSGAKCVELNFKNNLIEDFLVDDY